MKPNSQRSQEDVIADLNARCTGPDQFENFDRAFRRSLIVPKAAVLKEDKRWRRARAKKRAKKTG